MKLDTVQIDQFKCFSKLTLPLGEITALTGFNAAGKSTVVQSLLLLAQTLRQTPTKNVVALNNSMVRLGTAGDIVKQGSDGEISFSIQSEREAASWQLVPSREIGNQYLALKNATVEATESKAISSMSEFWPSPASTSPLLKKVADTIFLSNARLIGVEAYPDPTEVSIAFADVGCNGQFAPWWYIKLADEEVPEHRRHPKDPRVTVRGQIDAWLGELFPGASVNAEAVAGTSLSRLEFRIGKGSFWNHPSNTGFGLSYVFPLLVALTTAKDGQILIVDAPEGHLHPRAQSKIGAMLSFFAAAGVQIIIETHSDHVLSGIRIAVKNDMISAPNVALHFFQGEAATKTDLRIVSPTIDDHGSIDHWPEGFFDQAENDLALLAGWT